MSEQQAVTTSEQQSQAERVKLASGNLRGHVAEELAQDTSHFREEQVQLLKFHGIYQQEDRDQRQARKSAGIEKAFQFMIRSRIPGGVLTAEQYIVQDALASRFANGTLRITTRQGLQLHGVLKGNLRGTLRAINDALLSTLAACGDVNRNVMACPAPAGDKVHERIQSIARAIAQRLTPRTGAYHEIWLNGQRARTVAPENEHHRTIAPAGEHARTVAPADEHEPLYGPTYLPRKFKIGVAHPGDNCIDVYTQDIGLVAHLEDGAVDGFTLLVGGGMGTTHGKPDTYARLATPLCFASVAETLDVVETIVTIQRDFGDRTNRRHARMKYLVEERGIDWFRAEAERRLGRRLSPPKPTVWLGVDDHLGWHQQADGRWYLGLYVENGRIKDTATLKLQTALRMLVASLNVDLVLTGQQNVLLTNINADERSDVDAVLAWHGVIANPNALGVRRDAMACPALPTCGLALSDAERALPAVVSEIESDLERLGLSGERISIRMTGCPNGCARPFMGDIGFVGKSKNLYNVYVGGDQENTRLNFLYAEAVPTPKLRGLLFPLLELWRDERLAGETFGDYCHRVGADQLRSRSEIARAS